MLFFLHLRPYPPICPLINKAEQGFRHGVAAAALGAGHRRGICRGLPFDVEGLEDVTTVITYEFFLSSNHSCFGF